MFEKEAEERSENYFKERCYKRDKWADAHDLENMWQDGAEFGYNLAKEEIDYLNKHWGNEKDKANEWHYVKDGDLPKDDNYVLVSNGKDWTKAFYKDKKWNIICLVGFTKIIAWKEIVLPKELDK